MRAATVARVRELAERAPRALDKGAVVTVYGLFAGGVRWHVTQVVRALKAHELEQADGGP